MDYIYIVDAKTSKLAKIESISFYEAEVRERQDLEKWVAENPELLGEELFVVTTEYDKFMKSRSRLDVLALDKQGKLVVVELKLDAAKELADLQAIRYAAFCSTMTMEDIIAEYARVQKGNEQDAREAIGRFLSREELPKLDNRPRIILAAGSIDDQELTSSVLWLNSCGLDITCVELVPYRLSDGTLLITPKVLIPLPEAIEYTVGIQKKEQADQLQTRKMEAFGKVLRNILAEYRELEPTEKPVVINEAFAQILIAPEDDRFYYAWTLYRTPKEINVGLHLNLPDAAVNEKLQADLSEHFAGAEAEEGWRLDTRGARSASWRRVALVMPYAGDSPPQEAAAGAAKAMQVLVANTRPLIMNYLEDHPR